MSQLYISGGRRLCGEINVQGAKNGALPILAGTILCRGECRIHRCPYLSDVDTSIKILTHLGCSCHREGNTLVVNSDGMSRSDIPDHLMREMRSSIVLLGAIAARCGKAKLSSPGGCELGPRPIDLHIDALRRLGLLIEEDHGYLDCRVESKLRGKVIHLAFPSVGATENIMLAAATAVGRTVIHNAAREPEISDLEVFLNKAGAQISGAGTDTVTIDGVPVLHGTEHTVLPDRIVAATYMSAAAMTGGEITLKGAEPKHIMSVIDCFKETGCEVCVKDDEIKLTAPEKLCPFVKIRTMVYPGFPTDAGPIVIAMSTIADGTSMFVENIFENRYKYVDELVRLGAKIKVAGKVAVIDGVNSLSGAEVEATDLRGGAALVLGGLAANGVTTVDKIFHIDRGYENIETNLCNLGADIKRI